MTSGARQVLRRSALFATPLLVAFFVYLFTFTPLIRRGFGRANDLEYQLTLKSAQARRADYQTVLLGDSRVYRGIDPEALSLPAYNYGYDDDSLNYVYFKLSELIREKKPIHYAVIGLSYVSLRYLNYDRYWLYRAIFDDREFSSAIERPGFAFSFADLFVERRIEGRGLYRNVLLQLATRRAPPGADPRFELRDSGYLRSSLPGDPDAPLIDHDFYGRDPEVEVYLQRIIDLCRAHSIQPFLIVPPERAIERTQYSETERAEFLRVVHSYADPLSVPVFDHGTDEKFGDRDFYDASHLIHDAVVRFTRAIDREMLDWLALHAPAAPRR